ncbi:reverse transcriptase [Plakobranchus ocellatus]|uniref:Reverse transcriptase n=1 Tax=Plakobranchus ocellatus TaxID=259542 RepID=A0AAV3YUD7_9GAST|nr:reverse transcriptase [Plakobranchus ocellatus]
MATMEEIVKKADLLGYRGEKREEYLKQEFKLLEERQEKEEEAERQEKKEEAERQAREKKEEAERQAREKKEEAERLARENVWSREKWSSSLCALLTGRALDFYGRLLAEQAKDYDKEKEALMKRYDLTEDGYRRKFRTCKPAEDRQPVEVHTTVFVSQENFNSQDDNYSSNITSSSVPIMAVVTSARIVIQ